MARRSPLKPAELRAWVAFLGAQSSLLRRLEADLVKRQRLTLAEYDVLVQLSGAPGKRLRMADLSERVKLSPSGLTRLVDRLVRAGLVDRASCPSDRRGTYAALTTAGASRLERAAPIHLQGVRDHFARHLTGDQLRALTGALEPLAAGTGQPKPPAQRARG